MHRCTTAILAATVTLTSFAQQAGPPAIGTAVPGPPAGRIFTPADVFALQQATDIQISPDGRRIAFVRSAEDILTDSAHESIWLVDVATGTERPLLSGSTSGSASSPRWSPDSQRIAYIAADAAGKPQIFVRPVDSSTSTRVTDLAEAPGNIAWSPDGRSLAFSMFVPEPPPSLGAPPSQPPGAHWADPLRVITAARYQADGSGFLHPGYSHLFVVSADGGSPRQLTSGPYNDGGGKPSWTPDGRFLLFSASRGDGTRLLAHSNVFQVQLSDGALTQLTHGQGQEPAASRDGRLIAYTAYDSDRHEIGNSNLYVMDRDGSHPRVLTATLDRLVNQPHWAADGRGIYVGYDDHGLTRVALISLDGRVTVVADGLTGSGLDRPYTDGSFTVSDTGTVAFPLGAPDHPADVAVTTPHSGPRRLTDLNADLFRGKSLAEVHPLAVTSSFDGLAVGAWMVTPPAYDPSRRYPTILAIHGGPYGSYGPLWSTDYQLFAAAGYVVLYSNPRGSTSYGLAYARQIEGNFPGHDVDDLLSVVDAAITKGVADPNRLFITGGSAGGLLTAWIVGRTDRFKAAIAQKPIINRLSDWLTTDQYLNARGADGKFPWEVHESFWAHSPLALVDDVKTPTLIMVGAEDRRTPPSEAMQFYSALQLRGVPTALVLVPGAGHESMADRPSQLAAENAAALAWFARYGGNNAVVSTATASSR